MKRQILSTMITRLDESQEKAAQKQTKRLLAMFFFFLDVMPVLTKCSDAVAHVSMCASVLMIVALTFERHFAICNPHKYRIHLRTTPRWKHLAMYIAPVTIFSLFFNIPMFINLQVRQRALIMGINNISLANQENPMTRLNTVLMLISETMDDQCPLREDQSLLESGETTTRHLL